MVAEYLALLLELVGVDLTAGEPLLKYALGLWTSRRTVNLTTAVTGTVMETVAAMRERADGPDDNQHREGKQEQQDDTVTHIGSASETIAMNSEWWHDVTSFPLYSRSRRRGRAIQRQRITIG
jgi:hypothetical protein